MNNILIIMSVIKLLGRMFEQTISYKAENTPV